MIVDENMEEKFASINNRDLNKSNPHPTNDYNH